MKRYIRLTALFLSMVFTASCATEKTGGNVTTITTTQSVTTEVAAAEQTTVVSFTPAETTVRSEPQCDFITPELSEEKVHFYIDEKKVVHYDDLKKELNIAEDEAVRIYPYYIGNESADWLIKVGYIEGMSDYFTYVDLVAVKNGTVVKNKGKLRNYSYNDCYYDGNDFFLPTGFDGIIRYNFTTGEAENIGAEFVTEEIANQASIIDLNESYMLFYLSELLYLYNRRTGECVDTGLEFNAMTNSAARLEGDTILLQDNKGENKLIYDIKSGEMAYHEGIEPQKDKYRFTLGDYEFHSYNDEASDKQLLRVKRFSDGIEKTFDVDTYCNDCIEKWGIRIEENYIILCPLSVPQIAINFDTEQVHEITVTKGYEDWWYANSADGVSSALQLQNGAAAEVQVILPGMPYDKYGNLYPGYSEEAPELVLGKTLDTGLFESLKSYDLPADITEYDGYELAKTEVEEKCTGEELEDLRARNYTEVYYDTFYVGNDYIDWLIVFETCFHLPYYLERFPLFHRIYAVKDNVVIGEPFEIMDGGYIGNRGIPFAMNGDDIFFTTDNKVYMLETDTLTLSEIYVSEYYYLEICDLSERYLAFGDMDYKLSLYDRESGKVTSTGLTWESSAGPFARIDGDYIYSYPYYEPETFNFYSRKYDIKTGEISDDYSITADFIMQRENNIIDGENYTAQFIRNPENDNCECGVIITDKESGNAVKYSLCGFSNSIDKGMGLTNVSGFFSGDVFVMASLYNRIIVIDAESGVTAECGGEFELVERNGKNVLLCEYSEVEAVNVE